MTKFFRTIVPAIAAIALLAGASLAQGQKAPMPGPGDMPPHHQCMHHGPMGGIGMPIPMLLKSAKLTADQKAQVRKIFQSRRGQIKSQFDRLKTAHDRIMNQLLTPGTVNASGLSSQVQQLTKIRGEMAQARLQDMIAIRNLLTPDQLQAVAKAKANFDKNMAAKAAECKAKHGASNPGADPIDPVE